MTYAISWSPEGFDQMDRIVKALPERFAAFRTTLKTIASVLRTRPNTTGESREGARRVWFVDSLLVSFEVDDSAQSVLIQSVRLVFVP